MEPTDQVYIKLQQHLDRQAVGFPPTKTGAEIRILKHIFTPEEAAIASFLSYQYEPLEMIYRRTAHLADSPAHLEKMLDRIQKKGGIEFKIKNGKKHYCNAPFVVGMYEYQLNRLTPEFLKDFNAYTSDRNFGIVFLSTERPQMRTIPIAKSIHPQQAVSTFDEVEILLQQAEEPFVIIECICRKKKSMEGSPCRATDRKETCLAVGDMARMALASDIGREITREDAMAVIAQNQKDGLVLQPSNTEKAEFICSCCGCCCGMLRLHRNLPKPLDFWAANFHAVVDRSTCEGCGNCQESCQVDAVKVCEKEQVAVVNRDRCIGCGICVSSCPTESISLLKNPVEKIPPKTREELFDILMDRKKGKLGKWMLTGKLVLDAVRTGRTHLLKS